MDMVKVAKMAVEKLFVEGLNEIKKANPDQVAECAAKLFQMIEDMRLDSVVASKRTLNLFRSLNNLEGAAAKAVTLVDEALVARAAIVWAENSSKTTFIAFVSAFGKNVTKSRIVRESDFKHHYERLRLGEILS